MGVLHIRCTRRQRMIWQWNSITCQVSAKPDLFGFFFGWFVGCVCLFVCFSESPEHHSSHSKARPRANAGAALSSTAGILNTHGKQVKNCRKSQKKRIMLTARSTPGQLGTQLVRGWGCIRSENKVRRVCQLEMGKFCNYLNMSMPACSERRLGAWIHFYTCKIISIK